MREHEVPTHVQAEDRVLLGFTFPQVVAVMAVCAISYGAYRYAPVGPSEVRMALAVVFGLFGVAMVVGKIGGRRLPLVAADLLKYRLGARVYAGPVSQLVRSEPPAPAQPVKSGPGPLSLMAKRAGRGLGRLRKRRKTRKNKERRNGGGCAGSASAEGRTPAQQSRPGPPGRDAGEQTQEAPHGLDSGRGRGRPDGGGRNGPPGRPGRRPRALAGRDRLRGRGAGPRAADIRREVVSLRRPGRRHPSGPQPPWTSGCGPSAGRRARGCASGGRPP